MPFCTRRRTPGFKLAFEVAIVLVSLIVFYLISTWYYGVGFFDDTYIGLRYVKNLVDGHGLVWNIGEPPVEGFTNLGWLLLLSGLRVSDIHELPIVAKQAGMLFGCGTILLAWLISRTSLPPPAKPTAWIVPLHLSLTPIVIRHSISGMETSMTGFLLLTIALLWAINGEKSQSALYWILNAFLIFLSALSRPDAILFGVSGSIVLLVLMHKSGQRIRGLFVTWSTSLAALLAAYLVWKWYYFGSILPLPAYMKSSIWMVFESTALLTYVLTQWLGFVTLAAPLLLVILATLATRKARVGFSVWAMGAGTLIYGVYFLFVIPVMNVDFRFLSPLYAPLAILAFVSLHVLISQERAEICMVRPVYQRAMLSLVFLFFVTYNVGDIAPVKWSIKRANEAHALYGEIGRSLAGIPEMSAATSDVGQFPYFAQCRVLDLAGLTDEFVAQNRFRFPYGDPHFSQLFQDYLVNEFGLPDVYIEPPPEYYYALLSNHPDLRQQYMQLEVDGLIIYVLEKSRWRDEILYRLDRLRQQL